MCFISLDPSPLFFEFQAYVSYFEWIKKKLDLTKLMIMFVNFYLVTNFI